MFAAKSFVSLALGSSLLLAYGLPAKISGCDISSATIANFPASFTPPTTKPSFVAVAVGVQNYTCTDAGIYTNVGAVAELFDISCLYNTPIFDDIPDIIMDVWKFAPPMVTAQELIGILHLAQTPAILGQHYYITNPITGTGVSPEWDFTSQGAFAGNPNAYVVAARATGIAAPTGSHDIDWVELNAVKGSLASQVFRTDTRLGQPPATCTPGSPLITVKYVAKYWLYGGSIKK